MNLFQKCVNVYRNNLITTPKYVLHLVPVPCVYWQSNSCLGQRDQQRWTVSWLGGVSLDGLMFLFCSAADWNLLWLWLTIRIQTVCMYADHSVSSSVSSKLPCSSLKLVSSLTCSDNGFYLCFVAESGGVTKSGILPWGGAFTCNCQKPFKTTFSLAIRVQRRKIMKWL